MPQYTLQRQIYGIQCAQKVFGGPTGIWLECRTCSASDKITQSRDIMHFSDSKVAAIFRSHGWTGKGPRMLEAACPECSKKKEQTDETN